MDNRDKYVIFNFIKLTAIMWFVKPLVYIEIVNFFIIYLPFILFGSKMIFLNFYVKNIIECVMVALSLYIAFIFWEKYTMCVKIFSSETYMATLSKLKEFNYKFDEYLSVVSKVSKISTKILSIDKLAGAIGIVIDFVLLFLIHTQFRGFLR